MVAILFIIYTRTQMVGWAMFTSQKNITSHVMFSIVRIQLINDYHFVIFSPRRVSSHSDPTSAPINHGFTRDHDNTQQQQHHATQWRLHRRGVPERRGVRVGAEEAGMQVTYYFSILSQKKSYEYDSQLCK